MPRWVYRPSRTRSTPEDALTLVLRDGFLVHPIFLATHAPAAVARASEVAAGDVMHVYLPTREGYHGVASVEVLEVSGAAFRPGGGALAVVDEALAERGFMARLRRSEYRDPRLGRYTGWLVRRLDATKERLPGFDFAAMFPTRATTLWHYPDAELHRASPASRRTG